MPQQPNSKKPTWHTSAEVSKHYRGMGRQINRLMLLEHAWNGIVGKKSAFWVLNAVQGGTLFVKVKIAVARTELVGRRRQLIKELNKYFDTPWIKHIEIQ